MALPALNGTSSTASDSDVTGTTVMYMDHTVGTSLTDSLLVVSVGTVSWAPSSITWNSTALTKANCGGTVNTIWYLFSPESGTYSVTINFPYQATKSVIADASTFTGALGVTSADYVYVNGTYVSDTITTPTDDSLYFNSLYTYHQTVIPDHVQDSGQTLRTTDTTTYPSTAFGFKQTTSTRECATAGDFTNGVTISSSSSQYMSSIAINSIATFTPQMIII